MPGPIPRVHLVFGYFARDSQHAVEARGGKRDKASAGLAGGFRSSLPTATTPLLGPGTVEGPKEAYNAARLRAPRRVQRIASTVAICHYGQCGGDRPVPLAELLLNVEVLILWF